MAKEVAVGKRAKISEAQQHMLLAILGASLFLGVAVSLVSHFVQQISFNTKVIMAEEESIADYSKVIKNTGTCKSPSGSVYSDDELSRCDPNSIEVSEVPGTLRANILENLASNEALNSVPKEDNSSCVDSEGKTYTYKELMNNYNSARGSEQLQAASALIKSCSALRIIPDALPSYKNEEALLASLNKLFTVSGWEPESIMPGGTVPEDTEVIENLNPISVNFSIDANTGTVTRVLDSIERSIREFNINRISIEWNNDELNFQTQATAYYMNTSTINETSKTITKESK